MLNASCTSYAEHLSKHASNVLVNGRHAWAISNLFGQGSCGHAASHISTLSCCYFIVF